MVTHQNTPNSSSLPQRASAKIPLFLILCAVSLFAYAQLAKPLQPRQAHDLLFLPSLRLQTPLQTESDPGKEAGTTRIKTDKGGKVKSGSTLTLDLPPGFTTKSSWADVRIAPLVDSSLRPPANVLTKTEFMVGIWPLQEPMEYEKAIEIRIQINAAKVSGKDLSNLTLMMYNPETELWEAQPSFPSQQAIVAQVQRFKPVSKEFPKWGGHTFFCIARRTIATVKQTANLRGGPGMNYPIVARMSQGQSLELVEKTADEQWYKLSNGYWIRASLVSNPSVLPVADVTALPSTPLPTSTP